MSIQNQGAKMFVIFTSEATFAQTPWLLIAAARSEGGMDVEETTPGEGCKLISETSVNTYIYSDN